MPVFRLGNYGAEPSDSDDEEAPPAAPVGRVRDNTPVLVQCTRAYQTPAMPAPAPAVNPGQHRTRPWTPDEHAKLTELVAEHGRNWKTVAAGLDGDRTASAARQRWTTHVKPKDDAGTAGAGGKLGWTPDEHAKLTELVAEHGRNWKTVAAGLGGGRTTGAVRSRWDTHVKPKDDAGTAAAGGTKRQQDWTPDENAKLTKLVAEHGRNWKTVAAGLGGGRTTGAVRKQWDKHVKPKEDAGAKPGWTPAEDAKLTELVAEHGRNWMTVAAGLGGGRTSNAVERRWTRVNLKRKAAPEDKQTDPKRQAVGGPAPQQPAHPPPPSHERRIMDCPAASARVQQHVEQHLELPAVTFTGPLVFSGPPEEQKEMPTAAVGPAAMPTAAVGPTATAMPPASPWC
eukprot:COSAG06_NODE_2678_length_6460_cov_2.134884_6_plen_397_part_00